MNARTTKVLVALALLIPFFIGTPLRALGAMSPSEALIVEVERLRDSLPPQDVSRPELTLRLADLVFDQAVSLGKAPDPGDVELKALQSARRKAIGLYEEALSGSQGSFPTPGSAVGVKIEFQLARLYAEVPDVTRSLTLWRKLAEQQENAVIRREALLRLAESAEARNSAEADHYYEQALALCAGDLCSYGHFKRAWLFRNAGHIERALAEMQQALLDGKGQVREEALRDWVLFQGLRPGDGRASLQEVDALAERLQRPHLIQELSDSFFAAGNRAAGTEVLWFAHARRPTFRSQVRLLEETYGLRNWDRFEQILAQGQTVLSSVSTGVEESAESEKQLRRLLIQLDGERQTQVERVAYFKSVADLYLMAFPKSKDRRKVIEGWLAATSEPEARMSRIQTWLSQRSRFEFSPDEIVFLREFRAAAAQKAKDLNGLVEEMSALAALSEKTGPESKHREYQYLMARALYEQKKFVEALPVFQALAQAGSASSGSPDSWAVQSQHLALDVLAQAKDYSAISRQARIWTSNPHLVQDAKLAAEVAEMSKVAMEARFEQAVSLGEDPAALETFLQFCRDRQLMPRSCQNSEVLASRLKDEKALLETLELQGKESQLAAEAEAAGFFERAARLNEKILASEKAQIAGRAALKVALLYELAGLVPEQERVLRRAVSGFRSFAALDDQRLLLESLRGTGLWDARLVELAWAPELRLELAEALEGENRGDARTYALLRDSKINTGAAWVRIALAEVAKLDQAQRAIEFYGRGSAAKFERRVRALKALSERADPVLGSLEVPSRLGLMARMVSAYRDFAELIRKSPVPESVAPEARAQIGASLVQMAQPFEEKAGAYRRLATVELEKVSDPSVKARLSAAWDAGSEAPYGLEDRIEQVSAAAEPAVDAQGALASLHRNPGDLAALETLRHHYQLTGQKRLVAYFEGRLKGAPAQESKKGDEQP